MPDRLIAFVHIGKTGGLTMQSILAGHFGARHCAVFPWDPLPNPHALVPFGNDDLLRLRKLYPRIECVSGHHIMPYSDLDAATVETRYFTMLRDPVKRMASAYQHMKLAIPTYMSFEAYCEIQTHRDQQCRILSGRPSADAAAEIIRSKNVFVGLTEHYDESLVLMKKLFLDELDISYRKRNVARDNSIARALLEEDKSRAMLEEATREDRRLYEYAKEEVYPCSRDAYGPTLARDVEVFRARDPRVNSWNIHLSFLKRKLVYESALRLYRRQLVLT